MKTYRENGGIAPLRLDLGTGVELSDELHTPTTLPSGQEPIEQEARSAADILWKRTCLDPAASRSPDEPTHNLGTLQTELFELQHCGLSLMLLLDVLW